MGTIAGIALLVLGMALSIGPAAEERLARVLEERGVHSTATVEGKTIKTGGRSRSSYPVLDIEFLTDIGFHEENGLIFCGEIEEYEVGDEIEVIYDPEDPANVNFVECHRVEEMSWLSMIGVGALAAGGFFVLKDWHGARWKRGRLVGAPLALVGFLFTGASFDPNCACPETLAFGVALAGIGVVAVIGRAITRDAVVPNATGEQRTGP